MSAEEVAKFCPSCGRANPDSHKFCPGCGALLVLTVAQPVVENPPPPPSIPPFGGTGESGIPLPLTPSPEEGGRVSITGKPSGSPVPAKLDREAELPPPSTAGGAPKKLPLDPKLAAMAPAQQQAELQRLLTRANVERMRALIVPARKTLEEAVPLAEVIGPVAVAQVAEQQGDLLAMEERWQEAQARYAVAKAADPSRAIIEKKFAEMAVKLADEQAMARLGDVMLRGDSLGEILTDPRAGKRNAFLAMLTSALVPGLGQILAGQLVKGGIIMGLWLICLAIIGLSPDKDALIGNLTSIFNPDAVKGHSRDIGTMTWIASGGLLLTWVFAVFEAPLAANKTEPLVTASGQTIDKSGWEP